MKFILTTMAFVAAAAMGAIATSQEAVTVTVTVTDCGSSVGTSAGVFSTSIRTITASDVTGSATESVLPTPVGPVSPISEGGLSTSFQSATEGVPSAIISSVIESATSTIISVSGTSVEASLITSAVTSSEVVSAVTASSDFSTSWKSASASETSSPSATESSRTSASATSTTVPSNDATVTGIVGMTCALAVLAASLFNLA
ncbi:hypothetical protein QM012_002222 [Aureobasidium pullulans]|uniref:GPI anchored protein n=1 Tax=Aureobasidium pullulans TaxID=5580 RepID=A0ABR0TC75_AURPU